MTRPRGNVVPRRRRAGSIRVDVVNSQRNLPVASARIRAAVRRVLHSESVRQAAIEVAVVDDAAIRSVHLRFFGLDKPTDVITFPLNDPGEPLDGQIVVSAETAARVAVQYRMRPDDELLLYVIHGVLHLCGYDDHRVQDARRMRDRQQELLREFARAR